jgi:Flp pilus assembly protein TadB
MAASNTSGPDEPGELSAREKKILEGIEDDMLTADPALARHMTRADLPRAGTRWRAAARHGALLIAALIILVIAAAVLPSTWWGVLGLLTTLLLVPWILLFPTHHSNRD